MESETSKKQRFTKRRERAQVNQVPDYGSGDDDPPPRSFKDKPRSKPRKKKNNANLLEEDIIDGFAIISFKTYEDLEVRDFFLLIISHAWFLMEFLKNFYYYLIFVINKHYPIINILSCRCSQPNVIIQ